MSKIRATKDSIGIVSPKLDKRIRQACRTYYPDGSLTIGKIGCNEPLARRISQYTPNNPAYPAVIICSKGDNIVDFGSLSILNQTMVNPENTLTVLNRS